MVWAQMGSYKQLQFEYVSFFILATATYATKPNITRTMTETRPLLQRFVVLSNQRRTALLLLSAIAILILCIILLFSYKIELSQYLPSSAAETTEVPSWAYSVFDETNSNDSISSKKKDSNNVISSPSSPACKPHFQLASSNGNWTNRKFKRLYFYHSRKAGVRYYQY